VDGAFWLRLSIEVFVWMERRSWLQERRSAFIGND
jgi:hypothetical protein